jgi:hypothetical protein
MYLKPCWDSYRQRYLAKLPGFKAWVMLYVSCALARVAAERETVMIEKRIVECLSIVNERGSVEVMFRTLG